MPLALSRKRDILSASRSACLSFAEHEARVFRYADRLQQSPAFDAGRKRFEVAAINAMPPADLDVFDRHYFDSAASSDRTFRPLHFVFTRTPS